MEKIEKNKKQEELERKSNSEKYKEGLKSYEEALLVYRDWLQEQENSGKTDTPEMARESLRRHFFLEGMVAALGLSEQEDIAIMEKIGFLGSIMNERVKNKKAVDG